MFQSVRRKLGLGLVLAALTAPTVVLAAQATPEEAARLQSVLERYVGKPTDGRPAWATVVPEGDHYRATFDVTALVGPFLALIPEAERKGFALEWPPLSAALEPRDDGLWHIFDYRIPKLVLRLDGQTTEVDLSGYVMDAVTDPATGVTPSMTARMAQGSATSTIAKPGEKMKVTAKETNTDVRLDGKAVAGTAPGAIDMTLHQTIGTYGYSVDVADGFEAGVPDMKFTLSSSAHDTKITMGGFRNVQVLDLWAHLVAHHDAADFTTRQSTLKAKLAAAAPLFETLSQKTTTGAVTIESPFGIVKAGKIGADLDASGLTRQGRLGLALGIADFEVQSLFMPRWARRLVPSQIALAAHASGWDFATPISAFLDVADFADPDVLKPADKLRIAALALPTGAVEIVLDGNRVVGPLYDVALDGRLTAGIAGAHGAVTVRARGLDAVAGHLAGPDADDPQARALAAALAAARNYADRKGDDFVWRFDIDGDRVAVNGRPLK